MNRRQFLTAASSTTLVSGSFLSGCAPGDMDGYTRAAVRMRALPRSIDDLTQMVPVAALAPNSHNTQPWLFDVGAHSIAIRPDFTRQTPAVDPDDHHLWISLGCAAETLAVAGAALGRPASIQVDPSASHVGTAFSQGPATGGDLYAAIAERQSTRSDYDGSAVPTHELLEIEAAARMDGVSLALFTDARDVARIRDFVLDANSMQMDDEAFVEELRDWLRFNAADAMATGDGLFTGASGNPILPGWVGRTIFPHVFTKDSENARYAAQLDSSAGVAVFTADTQNPEGWVQVGRCFQRVALMLTARGIRHAHVNQPIEVPAVRPAFAAWLGAPDKQPDLIIRFGYAPLMPYSLRRPAADIMMTTA